MPIQFQTDFANLEGTVKELREGGKLFWYFSEYLCGGLTLAGYQVPAKATLSLLSSAGHERENIIKVL